MNNEILFKPNSIITAKSNCNDISSTEYKIYDTILQKCQFYQGHGFRKAHLNKNEFKNIIKNNNDLTIKSIYGVLEKFRTITLHFKMGSSYITSSAISEYSYNEEDDTFSIFVSDNVFNLLMNYATYGYSAIDLKLVRNANSYYTQKIYGMFRMWSKTNSTVFHTYKLTEIKEICDIFEGSCYDEYKIFKRDVLKKVLKEISNKLNMDVEIVKENRTNRKVSSIEFAITDHEPKKYNFNNNQVEENIMKTDNNSINDEIDSIDYMNLIDMNIKESVHKKFLQDFSDYTNYIKAVETASMRTLDAVGGKSINKRNYNYFRASLENLIR